MNAGTWAIVAIVCAALLTGLGFGAGLSICTRYVAPGPSVVHVAIPQLALDFVSGGNVHGSGAEVAFDDGGRVPVARLSWHDDLASSRRVFALDLRHEGGR